MLQRIKKFLRNSKGTKKVYRFLWEWTHRGFGEAVEAGWGIILAQKYSYSMVDAKWRIFGPTTELMSYLEFLSESFWNWKNDDPRIWLIYISCLIETGNGKKARENLERYVSFHGTKHIEEFLPVADMAEKLGIVDDQIKKARKVFAVLEANRTNRTFEQLIKDKTIAVVGNAGTELGTGRGKEIDGHDIVIRFNNFPTLGYVEDYGARTDIWVRGGNEFVEDRPALNRFCMVMWEPDYWHMSLKKEHLDMLYRDAMRYPEKLSCISKKNELGIYEKTGILVPTTGCYLLWMLYQIRGSFAGVDLYGFSFPYEREGLSGHYYDKLSRMTIDHNVDMEKVFLRKLYYEHGGCVPSPDERKENGNAESGAESLSEQPEAAAGKQIYIVLSQKQKKTWAGSEINGIPVVYLTETKKAGKTLKNELQIKNDLETLPRIKTDVMAGKELLFVCYSLGAAYAAYCLGAKYVLVHCERGRLLAGINAGRHSASKEEIRMAQDLENIVYENAEETKLQKEEEVVEYLKRNSSKFLDRERRL